MESARLWRDERRKEIGVVELDEENRRLLFHMDDADERYRIAHLFNETGEVTWAWTQVRRYRVDGASSGPSDKSLVLVRVSTASTHSVKQIWGRARRKPKRGEGR